jgi:hypothetical protein
MRGVVEERDARAAMFRESRRRAAIVNEGEAVRVAVEVDGEQ